MTLFVSFTMGYLSILITSSSNNVNELKAKDSKKFTDEKGKPYKLFQILMYMQPVFQKSMRKCLLYMIISMLLNVLIPREMYTE